MDRFEIMRTFAQVAESGGIGLAAQRMGIAKSAVSRRLTELEGYLGAQLFKRTTRQFSLTDSGQVFYEHCQRLLADLDEAELAVSQAHGGLRGRLRVAMPLSFGLRHLGPAIYDFMRLHPQVEFDLDLNDRQLDLLQEGIDVAIRIADLPDSSLIARRLTSIRHLVCASPDYLAAHGRPETPEQLSGHGCLVYSNESDPGHWRYEDEQGKGGQVHVPIRLRANNGDILCAAARAGLGLVREPSFILHEAIRAGELVPILTEYRWPSYPVSVVYPQTRHLSQRVRAFADFLVERFAGVPYWDQDAAPGT